MKKIFTLISVALAAMSVNAQTEETYKSVIVAADGTTSLASEFATVIDGEKATNVVDGKSIVTIKTENVTCEAVGGATPANVANSGAQQITAGAAIPNYVAQDGTEKPYAHEVASVEAWSDITWKNGNNCNDPINENNDHIYIAMGSGNPYIKLLCEEIVTDGEPTGTYKALYEYYKPGMDMPKVGLYYKFTTKVDGALKVQVWANKGNRNTYLINGQTKEQMDILVEGYVNGQKATDANGEKIMVNGKEMLKFFTVEEIKERHAAAKVKDGVDTAPYVIDAGNAAFWGNLIIDAKAGVDYWLFQDSSQIGFGGFTFKAGAKKEDIATGIETIKTISNTAAESADAPIYNLAGQKVDKSFKGVVIQNGVKRIQK